MGRATLLVFACLFFSFVKNAFGQNVSNEGTDFWAVFPTHVPNGTNANIVIFVTSKSTSEVTVTCGGYNSGPISIPANTSIGIPVNRADAYIALTNQNTVLSNKGIHVVVSPNMPKVSAYAHIYAGYRSAASLILPLETLGQKYFSVNYHQTVFGRTSDQGYNYLTVVAVEADTHLIFHEKNGNEFSVNLVNAGDAYEYMSGLNDLTGVYVYTDPDKSSCKKFAAFSGSSNITIGSCTPLSGSDPLYQQIYPTSSLGKNYGIVPFINQSYLYRAVATEDNTSIYQNGTLVSTLGKAGDFYTSIRLSSTSFITADKNILLSQYMYSKSCASSSGGDAGYGDPDMVLLNPVEFSVNNITVFSADVQRIYEKYINVLIKTNKTSSFKVNGVAPITSWTAVASNPTYSYAQIEVIASSLTLSAEDGFNAIAYGYGDTESYAYSAGTNLASNNYLTVVNGITNEEYQSGCVNTKMNFKINLPYKPDLITWTLDAEASVQTTNEPEVKVINGQTFYIYTYPENKMYSVSADHKLNVVAHVPNNAGNCQIGDLETNYIFKIYNLPTADFDFSASSCAQSDITFSDRSLSNSSDFPTTGWLWDFGDGSGSTEKNPKHQYASDGNYEVTLSVKSGTGCWSDPAQFKTVNISPVPVSDFIVDKNITCINTSIKFTDNSRINKNIEPDAKIVKWLWDFGDNTTPSEEQNPVHQYSSLGTKNVMLTTTSDKGCSSTSTVKTITITNLPVGDFTTPAVCFDDGVAKFVNASKNVDGTTDGLTYEWNFGDPSSSNNISTDVDGKHTFSAAGDYLISLKVRSANGCEVMVSEPFTVNGQVKTADFSIQNESNLCSNQDVIINNLSTAISGQITKIEIYKDFARNPGEPPIIVDYPKSEDIHLVYTPFGGNTTDVFKIRLVAYSGGNCFLIKEKDITLKPSPILEFADIPSACQDDGSVIINQARETAGINGNGSYSGDGVDAEGNFNPKNVSVGQHSITYTFTPDNGCIAFITKTINVYKSPMADAGPTLYILAGGQVKIPAVAEGAGLIYKWTPSLGLEHDDVLNPVASPETDTEYKLTATTSQGCTVTSFLTIKVLQALVPPNSFTPNGDGTNDVWNIKYLESYPKATIEVFNRNGMRVFFSNGYKVPFDGNYQNEPLPVGVYYYLINPRNGRKTITGPLTIIR